MVFPEWVHRRCRVALMTASSRRYTIAAVVLTIVGATFAFWPEPAVVPPRNTVDSNRPTIGSACRQVPEIAIAGADEPLLRHVLNRVGYGPRPGDVERLRQMGIAAYIDQQLNPGAADATLEEKLAEFETQGMSTAELAEAFYRPAVVARRTDQFLPRSTDDDPTANPAEPDPDGVQRRATRAYEELRQQKLLRAVASQWQLEEVLVDFWFNHFNVAARKGLVWLYLTEYERDAIRPHALGQFGDLLRSVAESPAMLFYLDNWLSSDPDGPLPQTAARDRDLGWSSRAVRTVLDLLSPGSRTVPDQLRQAIYERQRAPGVNENYARELLELHTLGVDGGYSQADVVEVARAFTGWTLDNPQERGGGFIFEPRIHAQGVKVVMGTTVPNGGQEEGLAILELLSRHPATAQLIATKLARRFVADDPPASVVDRAADCFLESGGQIRDVVRTILFSPEFLSPDAYGTKMKTPLEFVASAMRMVDADVQNVDALLRELRRLGMPPYEYQPPTGYPDRAANWINAGALLARMNFAVGMASNQIAGVSVDLTGQSEVRPAWTPEQLALAIGAPGFQRR